MTNDHTSPKQMDEFEDNAKRIEDLKQQQRKENPREEAIFEFNNSHQVGGGFSPPGHESGISITKKAAINDDGEISFKGIENGKEQVFKCQVVRNQLQLDPKY